MNPGAFFILHWPAMLCLLAGLALLIFEIFTPGFHIPGILGVILLVISVVLTAKTLPQALMMVLALLVVLSIAFAVALISASRGRLYRTPLVNKASAEEYLSTDDMGYFVGKYGTALTALRPAGNGDFGGVRLDVVTRGEFIGRGVSIKIIEVEGRRIVVAQADPEPNHTEKE